MTILPWLTFVVVGLLALSAPGRRIGEAAWRAINRLARHPFLSSVTVFVVAVSIGAILPLLGRVPIPSVHDEFANLLAADTFARGRLTNPTPAFAEHFETVHELMQPTYASKFPPGLSLLLAIGKLFDHAWIGAVLSVALGAVAVFVALREWIAPARWALLGGLLAATHPLFVDWGHSYWGGGAPTIGSGLLFAGAGRWIRHGDWRAGAMFGAGLFALAITRPFEGLIVAMMLAVFVLWRASRRWRALLAAMLILLPGVLWLGYYNFRVTGHATRLPWVEYGRQAMSTPIFIWQPLPAPVQYRHDKLRQFHAGYERAEFERQLAAGYVGRLVSAVKEAGTYWLDPPVVWIALAPCAVLAIVRGRRAARIGAVTFIGLILIHPALTPWIRPAYFAPAAAGFMLLMIGALRTIARVHRFGPALACAVVASQLAATGVLIAQRSTNDRPPGIAREQIVRRLRESPGRDIVLVRYTDAPQSIFEWVYNDADIESSDIVFARSIDPSRDAALLENFNDRQRWLLVVDGTSIRFDQLRE